MLPPKNARGRPITKLCLALETYRRTEEGRARDAKAFVAHFFPQDQGGSTDRLFRHMPNEVRAELLASWGIRGKKSALRDDDEKVRATVADALDAGDIDEVAVESGVTPEILVDWVPLDDWWAFFRGPALPVSAARKTLVLARELALFDERWFLEHLALPRQKLAGTDAICAALPKEELARWVCAVHERGDASPAGLVAALGWETLLAKTSHEALALVADALAREIGLAEAPARAEVAAPSFELPEDPSWAPPLAEPGDMGWDIVHGVQRSMRTRVQPRYNFDDDEEPTGEIPLPAGIRRLEQQD